MPSGAGGGARPSRARRLRNSPGRAEQRGAEQQSEGWRSSQAGAGTVPVRQPPARTQPLPEQQTKLQRACAQPPFSNAIAAQVALRGQKKKKHKKNRRRHDEAGDDHDGPRGVTAARVGRAPASGRARFGTVSLPYLREKFKHGVGTVPCTR